MGFALWLDQENRLAWAQGTQEYRAMGAAVIAINGQFRNRDFERTRACPAHLRSSFAGLFGSLEEVNRRLRSGERIEARATPGYVRWLVGQAIVFCGLSIISRQATQNDGLSHARALSLWRRLQVGCALDAGRDLGENA